jgi:hypothetical protein
MIRGWVVAAGLAVAAPGLVASAAVGRAQPELTAVTCTNPASGASWRLAIDFARSTVDSYPAEITPGAISWFDPQDGGKYMLDRKTGALTGSVASSTGGYFRNAHCALDKPR